MTQQGWGEGLSLRTSPCGVPDSNHVSSPAGCTLLQGWDYVLFTSVICMAASVMSDT